MNLNAYRKLFPICHNHRAFSAMDAVFHGGKRFNTYMYECIIKRYCRRWVFGDL
jgi:hypothetical protein